MALCAIIRMIYPMTSTIESLMSTRDVLGGVDPHVDLHDPPMTKTEQNHVRVVNMRQETAAVALEKRTTKTIAAARFGTYAQR